MWTIKQIFDGDYGCEEREEGKSSCLPITLINEEGAETHTVVTEEWLDRQGLSEKSKWPYCFWGSETACVKSISSDFPGIVTPVDLYDALSNVWCADTCAPRMRAEWTKENMTYGQCSITAFLAQDIFGGKVYGILRSGGNYHCYNVIGECCFDLTSEQFCGELLDYDNNPEQLREVHFAKEEKRLRYEQLKSELKRYCEGR